MLHLILYIMSTFDHLSNGPFVKCQSAIHVFTIPCRLCLLKTCLNSTRSPPYWMDSKITNDFLLFWSLTQVTLLDRIIQSVYTYICTIKFANPYFKRNLYQLHLCALVQKNCQNKSQMKEYSHRMSHQTAKLD